MIILYLALCILQLLDYISTIRAFDSGHAVEGNPLMKKLMDKIGTVPTIVLTKSILILLFPIYYKIFGENDYLIVALFTLCVFYSAVVFNNFRLTKE